MRSATIALALLLIPACTGKGDDDTGGLGTDDTGAGDTDDTDAVDADEDGYDGEDYSDYFFYDYFDSYQYNGCDYTCSGNQWFTVTFERDKNDLEGESGMGYTGTYRSSCYPSEAYSESYSYDYDADVESAGSGTWEIEVDDMDWNMECSIEGDELLCEGDYDGEDLEAVFERE